ncbi:MAG: PQQ-binding-like beta-propeller repeat protein, partial [Tistlia sp.]
MYQRTPILGAAVALALAIPAAAQAATVYFPQGSAGSVAVVDGSTDSVVGRLTGLPAAHGLGGAPGARYLVAGSYEETQAGATEVARPQGVSEDEHAAHHGDAAAPTADSGRSVSLLTILDAADGTVVRRLEVPGAVHHVAMSPDGAVALATLPNDDGVSIVELSDLTVRPLVRTGPLPNYVAFSPDGSRAYVSNSGNGTVSEIDVERGIVRRNLLAGQSPEHLVMAPDGGTLYVADVEAGRVIALSVASGEVVGSFAAGGAPHGLDLSDDGNTLFVSGREEDKLLAIDLASGERRSVGLAPAPYHVAAIR